jgi:predicted dehydrogenase
MDRHLPIGRRQFLSTAAKLGGVLAARPRLIGAQAKHATINVALIGGGEQGRVLIHAANGMPGIRFRGVCDIWDYNRIYATRLLGKFGHEVQAFSDYRELLSSVPDLDAVIIATPDFMHAEHANACLRAGKHVYCEKVMSNTVEGARSMVRTARETDRLLQIGHQRRSNPRYLHARSKLLHEARILGRITHAGTQWNRAVAEDLGFPSRYNIPEKTLHAHGYKNMHEFRNWRWFKHLSGGPICDLGAHQIDILNWFLDTPPRWVFASGGCDYYKSHQWYDHVDVIYEYATATGAIRATAQVLTTTSAGGGYHEYFMGDEAALKMSENPKYTKLFREARANDWSDWEQKGYISQPGAKAAEGSPDEGSAKGAVDVRETAELVTWNPAVELDGPIHQPHLANFFEAIRDGVALHCPAETAFATTVTVLKVNDSIEAQSIQRFSPADFKA